MRSTKVSIAARASAVLEESEGSGVPMDEETSPQDVSDGDMKSPATKKGEGGKTTTAKKKKKDGIVDKADGDKNRKAAFSPMKPVPSTNKPPCAPRGKAKTAYKESEESEEDEESEYETTTAKKKTSTNKPPCATRGKAKMAYEESEEDEESEYEEEENYNEAKDGDKKRKAASSPMKAVASTKKKPPRAMKGKAKAKKVCYEESEEEEESEYEEEEEEEESEYEEDDDHNQAKGSGVESGDGGKAASSPTVMAIVAPTKMPPCATAKKTVCFFCCVHLYEFICAYNLMNSYAWSSV